MKFFICDDEKKFKNRSYESFGKWRFYVDAQVRVRRSNDHLVLYAGYTLDRPIEEHVESFTSFESANGNFFAIKLTKDDYFVALDYFSNHKVCYSTKYGIEITNYVPFLTIAPSDVRDSIKPYSLFEREYDSEAKQIFSHIKTIVPNYHYQRHAKHALLEEKWNDPDELAEHVHYCMLHHARLIKELYADRYISLSDGIDSVLQSCYFFEDKQYIYSIDDCKAGEEGIKWKKLAASRFPNVQFDIWKSADAAENTRKYLNDPSTRGYTQLPTMKYLADCEKKPDICLFGVNGNEFSFRDLYPQLLFRFLHFYETEKLSREKALDKTREFHRANTHRYGADYSMGDVNTTESLWTDFKKMYINGKDHKQIRKSLHLLMSPKYYNRALSSNNDIMVASLFNDRRIYHEVFKLKNEHLLNSEIMDAPIFRKILTDKFSHKFETPFKDAMYADYDVIFKNLFKVANSCSETIL